MFVERRKLATLLQPDELQSCLAYWAWELPVNTTAAEYAIRHEVMQGVLVPDMHLKVPLCSSVVCPMTFFPSLDQFIPHRRHVHTHFVPWVPRNYQGQKYVLALKEHARGEIKGYNKHGPTSVWGSHHSIRIEPICY